MPERDLDALWGDVGSFIGIERMRRQQILVAGVEGASCRLGISIRWRGLTTLQFHLGEGCFFGLCPVGDGRTYGFGNMTQPRTEERMAGRLDRLRSRFAGSGGIVQDYLALSRDEEIHCAPVDWVASEEWHRGHVVLIGDAGHAGSPMMGQGGCIAMADACVLAETLRTHATLTQALDAYVARRRPRVSWVHEQNNAVAQSFRLPAAARNATLRPRGDEMLQRRFAPLLAAP